MNMEGSSKKRKFSTVVVVDGDEDQDNEEEKMEKFFALIKSIREARDRLLINGPDHALKPTDLVNTKKRKVEEEDKMAQVGVWTPTFQREDFMGDQAQLQNPPPPPAAAAAAAAASFVRLVDSPERKSGVTKQKKQVIGEELDLSLSL